jgi:hypothetical protein
MNIKKYEMILEQKSFSLSELVYIPRIYFKKFYDTEITIECLDGKKIYRVHRMLLICHSDFFDKFFSKVEPTISDSKLFEYKVYMPFTIDVMDICLKLFYDNKLGIVDLELRLCIEVFLALNYLLVSQQTLDVCISNIIYLAENKYKSEPESVRCVMDDFYHLLNEKDIFPSRKKNNIQRRIGEMCSPSPDRVIFISETTYRENMFIFTNYMYSIDNINFGFEYKNMLFTICSKPFHLFMKNLDDDVFIGLSSRPIGEKETLSVDNVLTIHERRVSGEEITIKAKGTIEIFNGLDDSIILDVLDFEETSGNRNVLIFPCELNIERKRREYGNFVNIKFLNIMTKFKMRIEFDV